LSFPATPAAPNCEILSHGEWQLRHKFAPFLRQTRFGPRIASNFLKIRLVARLT
jgi:hypothetical protein